MTILGAVLAGGKSSRFGADKAVATLNGTRLIDLTHAALVARCDDVVVIGRADGIPDWPAPDLGPLGGIAAALRHGQMTGHHLVLTCGVDSVGLPDDLIQQLSPAPAYVVSQPVIGLWPVEALSRLTERLASPGSHSMRAFADDIGARPVQLTCAPSNINTRDDLIRLERAPGER